MTTKQQKSGRVHSFRISVDIEEWVESMIQSHRLGSWTHAIEWGLALLKDKLEEKK